MVVSKCGGVESFEAVGSDCQWMNAWAVASEEVEREGGLREGVVRARTRDRDEEGGANRCDWRNVE